MRREDLSRAIIADYGDFLERHKPIPTRIEDASVLPHPKDKILTAILAELSSGMSPNLDSALAIGAVLLAQFQDGVGCEALEPFGLHLTTLPSPQSLEDIRAMVADDLARCDRLGGVYLKFNNLVEADIKQIEARIDYALTERKVRTS